MLTRHSSRRNRIDQAVLKQRLEGAVSYDRIAGYFRSNLFEVAEVQPSLQSLNTHAQSVVTSIRPDWQDGRTLRDPSGNFAQIDSALNNRQ